MQLRLMGLVSVTLARLAVVLASSIMSFSLFGSGEGRPLPLFVLVLVGLGAFIFSWVPAFVDRSAFSTLRFFFWLEISLWMILIWYWMDYVPLLSFILAPYIYNESPFGSKSEPYVIAALPLLSSWSYAFLFQHYELFFWGFLVSCVLFSLATIFEEDESSSTFVSEKKPIKSYKVSRSIGVDEAWAVARQEATKRKRAERAQRQERQKFVELYYVVQSFYSADNVKELGERLLTSISKFLMVDVGLLLLADQQDHFIPYSYMGLPEDFIENLEKKPQQKLLEQLAGANQTVDFACNPPSGSLFQGKNLGFLSDYLPLEGNKSSRQPTFHNGIFVSLKPSKRQKTVGLLFLANRSHGEEPFSKADKEFLELIAIALASIIVQRRDRRILENNRSELIVTLAQTIEAKDDYTGGHVLRVRNMACSMGKLLGFSHRDIYELSVGALLHDIGKIAIPDSILNKPGRLTEQEFEIMKQHTTKGAHIIKGMSSFPESIYHIVLSHHEHQDGTGYPQGLKGREIFIGAQIVSLCDCYDAMTTDRPYRKGMSKEKACQLMEEGAGGQFDPKMLCVFFLVIGHVPTDSNLASLFYRVQTEIGN